MYKITSEYLTIIGQINTLLLRGTIWLVRGEKYPGVEQLGSLLARGGKYEEGPAKTRGGTPTWCGQVLSIEEIFVILLQRNTDILKIILKYYRMI